MDSLTWHGVGQGRCPVVHGADDPHIISDPFAWYRMLRLQAPIAYSPELGGYLVTRHETVHEVLSDDGSRFSSAAFPSPVPNIFMTDDPDHARYRSATVRHLTARYVRSLEPYLAGQAQGFVDALAGQEEVDLLEAFAYPFPIRVVCHVLGIPESDSGQFAAWSQAVFTALTAGFSVTAESHRASFPDLAEMGLYFSALMDYRRRHPGPDVISALVTEPQSTLDDTEILMLAITLALAGHVTTATTLGAGMRIGLERPDIWESALRTDRWDRFTDEVLRYEAAAPTVLRRAIAPVTLDGVDLEPGAFLFCHLESANRDADVFSDPDTFRLDRDATGHLSFGAGPHFCIGSVLARLEARLAFAAMGPLLPEFVLAPDGVTITGETGRRVLTRLVVHRRRAHGVGAARVPAGRDPSSANAVRAPSVHHQTGQHPAAGLSGYRHPVWGQHEFREERAHGRERKARFQPGQDRADAEVGSGAEAQVPRRVPVKPESVGVGENVGVAVGRLQMAEQEGPRFEVDPVEGHGCDGTAEHRRCRGFVAQHLVGESVPSVSAQGRLPDVWPLEPDAHAGAQRRGRRHVPGEGQRDGEHQDFSVVEGGLRFGDQGRDDVRAGVTPPVVHQRGEVEAHLGQVGEARPVALRGDRKPRRECREDGLAPRGELSRIGLGYAEHVADDADGERVGERLQEVDFLLPCERVNEPLRLTS